jgi:hypothetical protein
VLGQLIAVPSLAIDRVRPHQIAKQTIFWYFAKSVNLLDVVELYECTFTVLSSGDMPPWRRRNLRLTRQARGRQSNISIVISYAYWLYLLRPI